MIPMIKHNRFTKISDKILWLNNNWVLKFAVDLIKNNNNGNRQSYYSEIGYTYNNEYKIEMHRDFNYYYIIESVKPVGTSKFKFRISPYDIYFVINAFKQALNWFTDERYKALFIRNKNGDIKFGMDVDTIKVDLIHNSYIEIEPAISQLYLNDIQIGVHLYLGSDDVYVFVPLKIFFALYYHLETCNMYQCACALLSFTERPDVEVINTN